MTAGGGNSLRPTPLAATLSSLTAVEEDIVSTPAESTEPSATPAGAPHHESAASLLGTVPITLFMKDGTLALRDGRLSFVTRRGTVFDHPVHEFHSLAASGVVGFHLWHADRCYKLVPDYTAVHEFQASSDVVNLAVNAGRIGKAFDADRKMKDSRGQWFDVLEPLIATAPPGVKVRRPWPTWAIWLTVVGVTLAIVAVITAIVFLTS